MAASACSDCMADCSTPSRLSLISKGKLEIIGKHYGACLRHRALAYGQARKRSRRLRRFDRWRWSDYWTPVREVVYFKRRVYVRALHDLGNLIFPDGLPPYPEWWPESFRRDVVRALPRLSLREEFVQCFEDQARRKPESSAARAVAGGIAGRLATNILDADGAPSAD